MSSRTYNTLRPSRKSSHVKSNLYSSNYQQYESSEKPNFSNSPQSHVQENERRFPVDDMAEVDDKVMYKETKVSACAKKTLSKSMAPKTNSHLKRVNSQAIGQPTKTQHWNDSRDRTIDVKSSHSS